MGLKDGQGVLASCPYQGQSRNSIDGTGALSVCQISAVHRANHFLDENGQPIRPFFRRGCLDAFADKGMRLRAIVAVQPHWLRRENRYCVVNTKGKTTWLREAEFLLRLSTLVPGPYSSSLQQKAMYTHCYY